ncbi:hypothetical protein KIH86_10915 [Paenibacillus sp. HN-1]|uniref:hypothetical protein n=1 Tax=Paenibacillus TaxID=44249 RepID=UPI001CA9E188|nr:MULTISPECIES: hypothetical protein [Paenibacillus]MBY9077491.1 hypothetical protein [Paenibacillus sp. CGMCC 1.18879]MBY9084732.1 hypothetical protein [Paenibacillus sinensis]
MLIHIRLGQKAATPDGRTLVRRPGGLFWTEGERKGALASDQAASLSDLWRIYEDGESLVWTGGREKVEAEGAPNAGEPV